MDSPQTVKDFFDPDRIYDLLYAEKIHPALLGNLANALGHHGIFDNGMPVVLVERMSIPSDFWAENWTGYLFEFLKFLSRTGVYANEDICGKTWGFDPPGEPNYDPLDLSDYYCPLIRVIIPPRTTGTLTWLERAHALPPGQFSAPYCDRVGNRFVVVMRRHREFVNPTDKFMKVDLPTFGWMHNSVRFRRLQIKGVNEDGDTVTLTEKQKDFLLYARINTFLNQLMALMELSQGFAMVSCRVSASRWFGLSLWSRGYPWRSWFSGISFSGGNFRWQMDWWDQHLGGDVPSPWEGFHRPVMEIGVDLPGFSPLPADYYYASMIFARGEQVGQKLTGVMDGNSFRMEFWGREFFDLWLQQTDIENPNGYTELDNTLEAISVPFPYAPFGSFSITTQFGLEPPFYAWPMTQVFETNDGHFYAHNTYGAILPVVLDVNGVRLKWHHWREPVEYLTPSTSEFSARQTGWDGIEIGWENNQLVIPRLSYFGTFIPVGDPHLFRDSVQVFFCQSVGFHYSVSTAASGSPPPPGTFTRTELAINHGFTVRTTYNANPVEKPNNVLVETGLSSAQIIHQATNGDESSWDDWVNSPLRGQTTNTHIEGFIIVHRHFR